jgi:phage-related protein
LIGYITLTARCNAGTAFGPAISRTVNNAVIYNNFSVVNNGDDVVFPSLVLKLANSSLPAGETHLILKVENQTNNSAIQFNKVYPNEEITVDMSIRRISSVDGTVSHNIYESWLRNYLSLDSGANNIKVSTLKASDQTAVSFNVTATFIYQPIRYI